MITKALNYDSNLILDHNWMWLAKILQVNLTVNRSSTVNTVYIYLMVDWTLSWKRFSFLIFDVSSVKGGRGFFFGVYADFCLLDMDKCYLHENLRIQLLWPINLKKFHWRRILINPFELINFTHFVSFSRLRKKVRWFLRL